MQRKNQGGGVDDTKSDQPDLSKEASVQEKIAAKRRNEKGLSAAIRRSYHRANEVVSVPVLASFMIGIAVLFVYVDPEPPLAADENASPWIWRQGKGKDVVGEVNCTTFFHQGAGSLVEFGHGSGGGVSIRANWDQPIRWVWDDGSVEEQEKLACPDVEEKLKAGKGRRGIPAWPLYNRYNKIFWTATSNSSAVTFRNALNPVTVQLHESGFRFENAKGAVFSVVDGIVEAGAEPAPADAFESPYVEYVNVPGSVPDSEGGPEVVGEEDA